MLFEKTKQLFGQLEQILDQITDEEYCMPILIFDNATLGQHTRHIIEHFQSLIESQKTKSINYGLRNRDIAIETDLNSCKCAINNIIDAIEVPDFVLNLIQDYLLETNRTMHIPSSYYREINFNIDHFIHHQALLKIGLHYIKPNIELTQNFGYADATIKYKMNVHTQLYT